MVLAQRQKHRSVEQNRKLRDKSMQLWTPYLSQRRQQRMKIEHCLTPYTKINSKWSKGLNVTPQIIKLLEENMGKTLSDVNHSRILYDPPPRVGEIKAK